MFSESIDGIHGASNYENIRSLSTANYEYFQDDEMKKILEMDSMSLYHQIFNKLKELEPSMLPFSKRAKVKFDQVRNFYNGTNTGIKDVAAMLDAVGAKIVWPDEQKDSTREVCFVDAKVAKAGAGAPPPQPENYLAVPLVAETGAGAGIVPKEELKSWVMVYRHHHAIRFRSDLIAVEIEKNSESMVPLLYPLDIVLVDRNETSPQRDGDIFVVREPGPDGATAVKRVYTNQRDHDTILTFISENPDKKSYAPIITSLKEDFDGDIRKAIVGRCVWAWSDLTRK